MKQLPLHHKQLIYQLFKNASILKNSYEIIAINDNMRFFNVSDDIEITRNIQTSTMESSSNNNIICPLTSLSNNLINLNDNRVKIFIILSELSSQNNVISECN